MDYAYPRHRGGPPPPPFASTSSSSSSLRERERERDDYRWEGHTSSKERLPLQSRRPSFDEERYYSRRPFPPSNGHPQSSSSSTGAGSSSTAAAAATMDSEGERFRGHPPNRWRARDRDRDRDYRDRDRTMVDDSSTGVHERDRRVSVGPSPSHSSPSGGGGGGPPPPAGPAGWSARRGGAGGYPPPPPPHRHRSLSPPPSGPSASNHSLRHRFEHPLPHQPPSSSLSESSSPKRTAANGRQGGQGQPQQSEREWSTSSNRGGTGPQGAPRRPPSPLNTGWSSERGRPFPPPHASHSSSAAIPSTSTSNGHGERQQRFESAPPSKGSGSSTGNNNERRAWQEHHQQQGNSDRRPFDNGWPRHPKSNGELNGWRDDKGKSPANANESYYDDNGISNGRRTQQHQQHHIPPYSNGNRGQNKQDQSQNQNNPPPPPLPTAPASALSSSNGSNSRRARSPSDSVRSRGRRSPSLVDDPPHSHLHSPTSSTYSSQAGGRSGPPSAGPQPPNGTSSHNKPTPNASASTSSTSTSRPSAIPPFTRANSTGQASSTPTFPSSDSRPSEALETRLSRSASASHNNHGGYGQNGSRAPRSANSVQINLNNNVNSNSSSSSNSNVKAWMLRRRSRSASPVRGNNDHGLSVSAPVEKPSQEFSSPRSLADRIGPLASAVGGGGSAAAGASAACAVSTGVKDLQDRIQPLPSAPVDNTSSTSLSSSSRGWTPPPRSPAVARQPHSTVQSAPPEQQSHRPPSQSPSSPPRRIPAERSYTPPPSLKRPPPVNISATTAATTTTTTTTSPSITASVSATIPSKEQQHAESVSPTRADTISKTDNSPSPKLASSPSDAAASSPRPSTAETQIDDSMMEEAEKQAVSSSLPSHADKASEMVKEQAKTTTSTGSPSIKFTYKASQEPPATAAAAAVRERLPRAPIPSRSLEASTAHEVDAADKIVDITATRGKAETVDSDVKMETSTDVVADDIGPAEPAAGNEVEVTTEDKVLGGISEDATMEVDSTRPSSPASGTADMAMDPASTRASSEVADVEDEAAKEFEKSLTSFIEVQEQESSEASIDVAALLEANRLRAPISLPLAVNMPSSAVDVYEIESLALQNHDLLDNLLQDEMAARDKRRGEKIFRLRLQYKELDNEWYAHCNRLEKIREKQKRRQNIPLNPPTPSVDAAGLSFTPATPSLLAPSGRANRRSAATSIGYGDAVRSEAEFLEILASLEDADMRDPNLRAMRTTATVPDQIIDDSELTLQRYQDDNGKVTDPFEHYAINKNPDNWTEDEIAIFCRRYALYPKQFGKIAAALPDKTTPQCVLFYYRSKKKIDFRALVDKRNRDGRRKRARAEQKGEDPSAGGQKKGPSLLGNLKRAKGDEVEDDDEDDPQTPGALMLQESTVLSTAKALTRQINGVMSGPLEAIEAVKGISSRPVGSRASSTKKAARFLSPPTRTGTEDSIAPPSDGAMAAAEALGFLAGGPLLDGADTSSRPSSAKQKKRKPSMTDSLADVSFTEDGLPKSANGAKRSRPHSSSYWSVADKNEFVRLLSIHGKNYVAISEGIVSKTAVQCKNFFQNNVKKLGLAEIADRIDGEFVNTSGELAVESPFGKEMPSVFGEPNGQAATEPAPGYFISSHHAGGHDAEDNESTSRGGGMHLHNLLDDAPDAEGGAHQGVQHGLPAIVDGDSSTEDEAEPARYAQAHADLEHGSRHPGEGRNAHYRDRAIKEELMAIDPSLQEEPLRGPPQYSHHIRSSSFGARATFPPRDQFSPPYSSALRDERGYSLPPRQYSGPTANGRYEAGGPYNGHWSSYEGRTVYSERNAGPGQSYYPRSRYEEGSPVPYYQRENLSYADSPVTDKSTALPYSARSVQSYYDQRVQSPHPPASAMRHQSDARHSDTGSPYYEHYNRPRAG